MFVQKFPIVTVFLDWLVKAFWRGFIFEKKEAERGFWEDLQNQECGKCLFFTEFHRTKTRGLSLKLLGDMIKLVKRQYFFLVGKKLLEFVDIAGCRVNTQHIQSRIRHG